jgi:hypothetical protein
MGVVWIESTQYVYSVSKATTILSISHSSFYIIARSMVIPIRANSNFTAYTSTPVDDLDVSNSMMVS